MSTTLSIDIGLHGLGCGWFNGPELEAAWYMRAERPSKRGPMAWREVVASTVGTLGLRPDVLVLETMRVYDQRHWKGDPRDLLELQGVAGVLAREYASSKVVGYEASVWKGQVPADVFATRVLKWVDGKGWSERVVQPSAPDQKRLGDVAHGLGVGLYHLGYLRGGKFRTSAGA